MLDNLLIKEVVTIIKAALTAAGTPYSTIVLKQAFQPTQQGIPKTPAVFFYKVGDRRHGYLRRDDVWDEDNSKEIHTETQQYETTFQVNALAIQDPSNVDSLTASDIVNRVAAIMQSDSTVVALRAKDIGILRITDVRNPYFQDDKQRNEASPSFDFILTHKQVIITESPVIETVEYNFNRV